MSSINEFLEVNLKYKETVDKYEKLDGILAVIIYLMVMIFYYAMGVIYSRTNLYFGVHVNLLLAIICIAFILFRKQKLDSIGFGKQNLLKSIIMGFIFGIIVLLINLVPGLLTGKSFHTAPNLIAKFLYYFIVIALVEEIIFRAYIQTRIYALVKKPILSIMLVAFLFMSVHIPYQMYAANMDFVSYISNNFITLIFTFVWHIVFNFMYTKYNSIAAPTIFHTFMNWSNYLFM